MKRGFWAQRRADEFDALVEGFSTVDAPTRDADLLQLVGALRGAPEVAARPEFVADLRSRLMAEAETALVPTDLSRLTLPPRRTRRERRLAVLVGGIAIVGASTSVAVASQSALPGESLYPIKRVFESAHAGLSLGDGDKGRTELSRAATRLDEVASLTQHNPADAGRVAGTLSAFTDEATRGADLLVADYDHHGTTSSISSLREFAVVSIGRLEALEPSVPFDARDELRSAASVLAQIDAQAAQRCPSCDTAPVSTLPAALAGETIELPTLPTVRPRAQAEPSQPPGETSKTTGGDEAPDLPQVGGSVGPGSVQNPSTLPTSNPVRSLTEQLTRGLSGGGSKTQSSSRPVPSSPVLPSAPTLDDVAKGVGDILQGALTPITDTLTLPDAK